MGRIHANGANKIYMRDISYLIYTLALGVVEVVGALAPRGLSALRLLEEPPVASVVTGFRSHASFGPWTSPPPLAAALVTRLLSVSPTFPISSPEEPASP